jgi:hypothetical protein
MQEVDMLASHGLWHVWQDFSGGKRVVFHFAIRNLNSFFVQSLDDPLCEILPPRGKDHLEGFLVTVEIGHVAHRRSSGVRSERSAEKLQLVINTWRKKLKLKSSAASSPG